MCFLQSQLDNQCFQINHSALLAVNIITTELVNQTKKKCPSFIFIKPSKNLMHKIMGNQA